MMAGPYRIDLEMFEGPLDLLLFLIKRDEVNIYDIPIAGITRDFLEFVDMAKQLELHSAGDFILMAATLMKIKARMLLPVESDGDEEVEDPRTELVNMLLEYKRFKEAAFNLGDLETRQRPQYYRLPPPFQETEARPGDVLEDIKLYDIMLTFKYLLQNYMEPAMHAVELEEVSLTEQIGYLNNLLAESAEVRFSSLMERFQSRLVIVVTFLALLDMLRIQTIRVKQSALFDDLVISRGAQFGNA